MKLYLDTCNQVMLMVSYPKVRVKRREGCSTRSDNIFASIDKHFIFVSIYSKAGNPLLSVASA